MTVSVIIPAYNAEAFIDETLRSVHIQTIPASEVIVVDDGSTDRTAAIVRLWKHGVRLVSHLHRGCAAARNSGARLARGDYLAFVDADDLWAPSKLEKQLATGAPMVYTDRYNIGAKGDLPDPQSLVTPLLEGDIFMDLLLRGNFITASSVLVRRDVFWQAGGFCEALETAEDWDLWLRIAAEQPVAVVREPLVTYRFHAAGHSRDYRRMWRQREHAVRRALALPRGRSLRWRDVRKAWAETWRTNGWEAEQARDARAALRAYTAALWQWPFSVRPYKGLLRLAFGR